MALQHLFQQKSVAWYAIETLVWFKSSGNIPLENLLLGLFLLLFIFSKFLAMIGEKR